MPRCVISPLVPGWPLRRGNAAFLVVNADLHYVGSIRARLVDTSGGDVHMTNGESIVTLYSDWIYFTYMFVG